MIRRKVLADLELSPQFIADVFAEMDSSGQALFFVEVAKIAATWGEGFSGDYQWLSIGESLVRDATSTEAARDIIRGILLGFHD